MDNADKIRKLLWGIRSLADNDEPKPIKGEHEPCFPRIVRLADEALALLPCETCGGTSEVNSTPDMSFSAYRDLKENPIPCPECQGESNG